MPPRSKSRTSSVAQELVLALSKPKISKDDNNKGKKTHKSSVSALTNKKEVAKSPSIQLVKKENTSPTKINDDWISFLKNKQEDVGPVIKDVRSVGLVKPKSKGAFLIEAKQLVFCEVIFVYFWNYFHANVWQNVKDLTPYFDRHIYLCISSNSDIMTIMDSNSIL